MRIVLNHAPTEARKVANRMGWLVYCRDGYFAAAKNAEHALFKFRRIESRVDASLSRAEARIGVEGVH
jgi:hypothetical protein